MIKNCADKLLDLIDEKQNPSVVGLDPSIEQFPSFLKEKRKDDPNAFQAVAETIVEFNCLIIDAVADIVPAVKPQMAFYEQYGSFGVKAFEETVDYAKQKGLLVIDDSKRNDIGSTAAAYANAHLGRSAILDGSRVPALDADYLTVNPYLGSDGIKPFIDACREFGKGIFALVKTSNPSSGELQDKMVEGRPVYEVVAELVEEWGRDLVGERGYSSIGAVVGATFPEEAERLRAVMPKSIFLAPGYGAQGGTAKDLLPCFNDDGYGAIVNSSRGIIYAYSKDQYKDRFAEEEFHLAARQAALDMRDDIVRTLKENGKAPAWV